jgi:hypothetical protein
MAMPWNYRIVKYADGDGYGLHEVYYREDGEYAMTENPAGFVGDTPEEVVGALMMAKMDASRRPIFEEPSNGE